MLTEQVTPVTGSVDKESERVALKLEGNDSLVMEIGLYNLTNDEVPALIHFEACQAALLSGTIRYSHSRARGVELVGGDRVRGGTQKTTFSTPEGLGASANSTY